MNLHELVSQLISDTTGLGGTGFLGIAPDSSLGVFLPELVLCLTIVLMLLVRVFAWNRRIEPFYLALLGSAAALYLAWFRAPVLPQRMEIFTGMLVFDSFSVLMRSLILLFLTLFLVFTRLSGIPDREDGQDIYTLIFGSILGMCLMTSANHLLMVFLAVEMASVPSYALAGLMKGRRTASEAALKYAVYGAGAAGVMLYGISLIAGVLNAVHLPTVAATLAVKLPTLAGDEKMVLALGALMIMVGLAFKLSAVPFHFWCPDVFEGATAEVDAFLSVASKAAALALLVRVAIGMGVLVAPGLHAGRAAEELKAAAAVRSVGVGGEVEIRLDAEPPSLAGTLIPASSASDFAAKLIALIAVVTCTFGNLAAYGQTNIKRLLAYSTIAHAGYMMMAVPPLMAMAQVNPAAAERAVGGLAIYLVVYLFMNLGAFAVVAFLRNAMRSEEIKDYAGLIGQCPGVVICFCLMLFGLVGLPPLSGFVGKFAIFASLAQGYWITSQPYLLLLLIVGGVNTAISLVYYLRLVKVMTMDAAPETRAPFSLPLWSGPGAFLVAITLPTGLLITGWDFLNNLAQTAARQLLG